MSNFVVLKSALPGKKWLRLPTDQIADVVPLRDAGLALIQMRGGFEAPGYVAELEWAVTALGIASVH